MSTRNFYSADLSAYSALLILIVTIGATFSLTACGSGSTTIQPQQPQFSGNTNVTILVSSAANDQITDFELGLQSLTLTSQSGNTVKLLASSQSFEYIHSNGTLDLLATVAVPQGIYPSAGATMNGAQLTCVTLTPASSQGPGSLDTSEFSSGFATAPVTINFPSSLTITGKSMVLLLDLQVSQSASFSNCYPAGTSLFTPLFNLAPMTLAAQPTNSGNGRVLGLRGTVMSVNSDGSGFALGVSDGEFSSPGLSTASTTSIAASSTTLFQGISGLSALTPGMFVNMDGSLQSDGNLLATRVEVEDPGAENLLSGPLLQVSTGVSDLIAYGRLAQGTQSEYLFGPPIYNFGSAEFQISGQLSNLQSLPFTPAFNASNMVPGQNVDIASGALVLTGGVYTPASTITLIPQTVDAEVVTSSANGNFTVYSVGLAPYDLFPTLALQPGQTVSLNDPNTMDIYVDSNTQTLNSQPLSAGGTFRFYGLVFNDNGTLRMDCAQVSDGVAFTTPPPSSSSQVRTTIQTQSIEQIGAVGLTPIIKTKMRQP